MTTAAETDAAAGAAPVDIYSPDWYATGDVHGTFAELRGRGPVHWQDMPDEPGFWAVLRHADVAHVAKHPELFSASELGVVLEDPDGPEQLERVRHMLLSMDPPTHTAYRRPVSPHFTARVIGAMEDQVRSRCRAIFEPFSGGDEQVDLVHDVAGPLPAQMITSIMGLPESDTGQIQRWAEVLTGSQDRDLVGDYQGNAAVDMAMYGIEWAARRRAEPPRDDITSLLLETTYEDGRPMSDVDFGSFFVQLVTAGNDTTKTSMAAGTLELIRHPDQQQLLRDDPALLPTAVEEIVRYCNPLHYFRRTAVADTEIGGAPIGAGDKVAMMYTSANRDASVFTDPQRFDVRRSPNPHLSFGIGAHFCLGAHLARLEIRVFLDELLATFPALSLAGEPVKIRSNLNNGYRHIPVLLGRTA
jgi:cytochrome P450